MAWGNLLAIGVATHDWLVQNYHLGLDQLYWIPYWQIAYCLLFCLVLGQRYLASIRGLEASQAILARRLAEREAELEQSHRQLREVERREVLANERQRLMRDMHDGLGSSLTGALRMAGHGATPVEDLERVLLDCIDELKLTIDSLEPMEADLALLLATLRSRLQPRLQAAGMELRWAMSDLPELPWLSPGNALHVLRILQEVIGNILKHAQASEVGLSTEVVEDGVQVSIVDNGNGFTPESLVTDRKGRGLGNIHQRADALRARASWTAMPGGTCFTLWLPLMATSEPPPG